jgi:hypothetical protein
MKCRIQCQGSNSFWVWKCRQQPTPKQQLSIWMGYKHRNCRNAQPLVLGLRIIWTYMVFNVKIKMFHDQNRHQFKHSPTDDIHRFRHRDSTNGKAAAYFLWQSWAVVCDDVMSLLCKLTRWTDDKSCPNKEVKQRVTLHGTPGQYTELFGYETGWNENKRD